MSSLINVSEVLDDPEFRQDFKVFRNDPGSRDPETRRWVDGAENEFDTYGSIQPPSGSDMKHIQRAAEGGTRVSEAIRIYSEFDFSPGTLGNNATTGDEVEFDGLRWSVVTIGNWRGHGHKKVFGVRFDGQNG